ncbi:hypothetical protein [Pseudonocardia sp.]|uniref:hypothetical protein n=1 Tax=Pseudonocardia sp. TaxID=60912 RepID=UPI002615ED57|nr:hypothetical protein [Pseudonocardia sp.]
MDVTRMGEQALTGWRRKAGEPVAEKLSQWTRLDPQAARAVVGGVLFLIPAWYVTKTVAAAIRAGRG